MSEKKCSREISINVKRRKRHGRKIWILSSMIFLSSEEESLLDEVFRLLLPSSPTESSHLNPREKMIPGVWLYKLNCFLRLRLSRCPVDINQSSYSIEATDASLKFPALLFPFFLPSCFPFSWPEKTSSKRVFDRQKQPSLWTFTSFCDCFLYWRGSFSKASFHETSHSSSQASPSLSLLITSCLLSFYPEIEQNPRLSSPLLASLEGQSVKEDKFRELGKDVSKRKRERDSPSLFFQACDLLPRERKTDRLDQQIYAYSVSLVSLPLEKNEEKEGRSTDFTDEREMRKKDRNQGKKSRWIRSQTEGLDP